MRLQVVAFDVDGTLYPNWAMYLLSSPFAIRHFRSLKTFAKVRKDLRKMRPVVDFYNTQAELFGSRMGLTSAEAADFINKSFYGSWDSVIRRVKPFPHIGACLKELKNRGLKLAVLSDFPLKKKLEYLGLDGYWDLAFSSEDTGYLKPNPEPFSRIVEHFSVLPQEILYVGNSYAYDVVGAGRQGFRTAHLTQFPRKKSLADFSFYDYRKLLNWILSIL